MHLYRMVLKRFTKFIQMQLLNALALGSMWVCHATVCVQNKKIHIHDICGFRLQ